MDFNPDHAKWQCCCCHLAFGLKILAFIELSFSISLLIFTSVNFFTTDFLNQDITNTLFNLGMIFTMLVFGITSVLLIVGIVRLRDCWMYPSLCARVILIMFVTIFGVKQVVIDPYEEAKETQSTAPRMINGKLVLQQDKPPMVLRLIFFMFLMIFVCIGIMYTIYLVVRCVRYVQAYARLENRRASLIFAKQIDPEMMDDRRGSRASQI